MVMFLIIFATGIAVLLAAQAIDIECQRPRRRGTKAVPSRAAPSATGLRTFSAIRAAR